MHPKGSDALCLSFENRVQRVRSVLRIVSLEKIAKLPFLLQFARLRAIVTHFLGTTRYFSARLLASVREMQH